MKIRKKFLLKIVKHRAEIRGSEAGPSHFPPGGFSVVTREAEEPGTCCPLTRARLPSAGQRTPTGTPRNQWGTEWLLEGLRDVASLI